ILRATNILLAGRTVVVAGYGMCGRGVAARAKGLGAHVIVTEVEPMRALEGVVDGFQVMPMTKAAAQGDLFVTVTGNTSVMSSDHFGQLKDGAILCNSGHFNVEIDLETLGAMARARRAVRPFVEEFVLDSGRRVYLLGEGRLINLTAAEGHPASAMDMSFANQALSAAYMVKHGRTLALKASLVPPDLDLETARLKLGSLGGSGRDLGARGPARIAEPRDHRAADPAVPADRPVVDRAGLGNEGHRPLGNGAGLSERDTIRRRRSAVRLRPELLRVRAAAVAPRARLGNHPRDRDDRAHPGHLRAPAEPRADEP